MDNIYESIEEYNPNKKGKILILFDNKTADTLSVKEIEKIVTELLIRDYTMLICCMKKY